MRGRAATWRARLTVTQPHLHGVLHTHHVVAGAHVVVSLQAAVVGALWGGEGRCVGR